LHKLFIFQWGLLHNS